MFVVASGDGYTVMPGGLTRVSSSLDPLRLSLVDGERSKDTWVLSDGPVAPVTLLTTSDEDVPLRRGGVDLAEPRGRSTSSGSAARRCGPSRSPSCCGP